MDSKGKKISLILITGIMTVLPLVGRTADSGNLLFLAMLVAISAVMLCNNVFKRNISLSFNLTDIAVLFFCIYVFIRDIQSTGLTAERSLQYSLLALLYLIVKTSEKNPIKAIAIGILLCGVIQSIVAYLQLGGIISSHHNAFACTGLFYISLSAMFSSLGAEAPFRCSALKKLRRKISMNCCPIK